MRASIIMPVYNGARFIAAAIESVYRQSMDDWELIVVDDGSTDESAAIAGSYGARVRLLRQENRGLSAARNAALAEARAEYVALLDADDCWEAGFLEHLSAALDGAGDEVAGVFSGWLFIDGSGEEIPGSRVSRPGRFALEDFLAWNLFPPSSAVLRRSAIAAGGGFDEHMRAMEDWDLWLRMTATGGVWLGTEPLLCRYRVHGGTISRDVRAMRAGRLRALEKLFARPDLREEARRMSGRAFSFALVESAAQLCGAGSDAEGIADFCEAVRRWPEILSEEEPYYALLCATQPIGFKATSYPLDLAAAEGRVVAVLDAVFAAGAEIGIEGQRAARARAYLMLARLAYGQGRMGAARGYWRQAARLDWRLGRRRDAVGLLLKSFAGRALADRARRWKRVCNLPLRA